MEPDFAQRILDNVPFCSQATVRREIEAVIRAERDRCIEACRNDSDSAGLDSSLLQGFYLGVEASVKAIESLPAPVVTLKHW